MLRAFTRRIPSLLRPCSFQSISYAVSPNFWARTNVEHHGFFRRDRFQPSPNLELLAAACSCQTSATRSFAKDSKHLPQCGDLPATVGALKNPTNQITYDESCMNRHPPGDPDKRAFTYFTISFGRFFLAAGLRLFLCKVILSMSASKDVLAMASLEMDVSGIAEGNTVTVKWRGKPVFVRNRSEDDIKLANSVNMSDLRDPQADSDRASNPTYLIVVGVCTHLGCVPLPGAGDYGGWFCPCHGSHYDISGRIRKGPAPRNLEVPEYKWIDDTKVVIG